MSNATIPSLSAVADYIQRTHNIANRRIAEQMAQEAIAKQEAQGRYERKLEEMRKLSYQQWLEREFPNMDWQAPVYKLIIDHIQAILDGDLFQLIINIPPRLGKSTLVTIRLPVFWLLRNPDQKVLIGAYNSDLAKNFTEESLKIYKEITPATIESSLADEWTTIYGGMVKAVGAGASAAGFGANLLVIDDPIKNYSEAHSPTYQKMIWNWYLNDMRTRRNELERTPTILIHTRWTPEDLTGRITASSTSYRWTVLSIPAIAEEDDPAKDPLGRKKGESIHPVRLPIEDLAVTKEEMGREFDSLYQQNPKSEASYTFKSERIIIVDAVPLEADRVLFFDRAGTEGGGDYTVGVLMAQDRDGFVYVEDVIRGQWGPEGVEKVIEQSIKMWAHVYAGKRNHIMQFWVEQEPASSGKAVAYATVRKMAGYEVYVDRPSDNKDVRSRPYAAYVNANNVRMKKADWNPAYVGELGKYIAFGKREHDDQVDASSGAFSKLTIERLNVESS